ncbi:uncharacterized protein LY89DRAFT_442789 [Mollisia scopiformis]|uniref:DNA replication regulator Sld3 C-terminal domain-containing protein n=1 Tax=Mollisia scopiformis TaxID=149040 RepID=A0A194XJU6_MOLSC|nr:uncharacterized protein LY89DRAFT_442789 [Mollisia scopiformis]KUJ20411.1 hypothetical protein LY89DRAFT_442789 [Mollisia scopiformis]
MFGQDEHDASGVGTRSGILTPASDNSLNSSDGFGSSSKKRKRDGSTMDDLLKDKFVVKPYPTTNSTKQHTLQPLILLPRSRLPLSSLDIVASAKALSHSRLYEAHVKILELEERMGTQPMVLIARLDDARTLYAVERESLGLYVLCQLGSWVNLQELRAAAVASKQELPRVSEGPSTIFQEASLPTVTPEINKYNKKKRLAIEAIQSMVKRPISNTSAESQSIPSESAPAFTSSAGERPDPAPILDDVVSHPDAAEIFENVRTQYFEALYLSMASLAYFAKGPLSRARAAFHMDFDSTLDLKDHVNFLESLILSNALIDSKYRDGVPTCVSLLDIQDQSEDNANPTAKVKRRKSNKKQKPGKNGLYPTEDTLIRKWWNSHDDEAESGAPGDSRDERTKRRISQLRIRETQLQIIIILEVLALQPLASSSEDIGEDLPTALPTIEPMESKQKQGKSKKPQDLTMLIDLHIDRLCIWQSVALEEATKGHSSESQNVSENIDTPTARTSHTDNILRDFCVEVIAPFFSSRLPDKCAAINRKLGGPVVVSPPRPKLSKSASFSGAPSRPGAATKRPVPAKPRHSLKRVLTDDRERRSMSRGPNKAISLMRSATMPIVPGMKREASEAPSLSSIPSADSQTVEANRGGLLNSRRFSRREIDLSAMAPKPNAKAEKQAVIQAELKEAISALKKPNRELAGKSIVETAEKRSASISRKSKKPVRNPLFQSVQISATPKANRQRDMFARSQHSSGERSMSDFMAIPPSSLPMIPQSVSRSSGGFPTRNPFLSSVQATPTRKPVPSFSNLSGHAGVFSGDCPPSSPLHIRRSSAQLFPAIPDSAMKKFSNTSGIADTPVKATTGHAHPSTLEIGSDKENLRQGSEVEKVFNQSKNHDVTNNESIYKALGWDDDLDELA